MSEQITLEVKAAAHEIIYEAMMSSIAALNAALAIYEITIDQSALEAIDCIGQSLRAMNKAALYVYRMPVVEDTKES
jgi:hypothetical protein